MAKPEWRQSLEIGLGSRNSPKSKNIEKVRSQGAIRDPMRKLNEPAWRISPGWRPIFLATMARFRRRLDEPDTAITPPPGEVRQSVDHFEYK